MIYTLYIAVTVRIPISIEESLSNHVEERTRGQRICSLWKELHKGRIRNSILGSILIAEPNLISFVDQIKDGSSLQRFRNKIIMKTK